MNNVDHKLLHKDRVFKDHWEHVMEAMFLTAVGFENKWQTTSFPIFVEEVRPKPTHDRFNEQFLKLFIFVQINLPFVINVKVEFGGRIGWYDFEEAPFLHSERSDMFDQREKTTRYVFLAPIRDDNELNSQTTQVIQELLLGLGVRKLRNGFKKEATVIH